MSFCNYTKEKVFNISKLEIFLVLFPVVYLNIILIPDTNNVLKYPLDLGEFMMWFSCLLYMTWWIRIPERCDWWSVTLPVMHIEDTFCLNKYMSHHRFDEILVSLMYTNREEIVQGDLIDQNISDKEVRYLDMLEYSTEDGNPFCFFCFKSSDYVINIMASWMTLDDMKGGKTRCNYKGRDGESLMKIFKFQQPFGFHFR